MTFKSLSMTEYFKNSILQRRVEFLDREKDIIEWISHPTKTEAQSDGRIKIFARDLKENKWVRIILLEDGKTIHNIFYDRNFKG